MLWGFAMGASIGGAVALLVNGRIDKASLCALVFLYLWGVWILERDSDGTEARP